MHKSTYTYVTRLSLTLSLCELVLSCAPSPLLQPDSSKINALPSIAATQASLTPEKKDLANGLWGINILRKRIDGILKDNNQLAQTQQQIYTVVNNYKVALGQANINEVFKQGKEYYRLKSVFETIAQRLDSSLKEASNSRELIKKGFEIVLTDAPLTSGQNKATLKVPPALYQFLTAGENGQLLDFGKQALDALQKNTAALPSLNLSPTEAQAVFNPSGGFNTQSFTTLAVTPSSSPLLASPTGTVTLNGATGTKVTTTSSPAFATPSPTILNGATGPTVMTSSSPVTAKPSPSSNVILNNTATGSFTLNGATGATVTPSSSPLFAPTPTPAPSVNPLLKIAAEVAVTSSADSSNIAPIISQVQQTSSSMEKKYNADGTMYTANGKLTLVNSGGLSTLDSINNAISVNGTGVTLTPTSSSVFAPPNPPLLTGATGAQPSQVQPTPSSMDRKYNADGTMYTANGKLTLVNSGGLSTLDSINNAISVNGTGVTLTPTSSSVFAPPNPPLLTGATGLVTNLMSGLDSNAIKQPVSAPAPSGTSQLSQIQSIAAELPSVQKEAEALAAQSNIQTNNIPQADNIALPSNVELVVGESFTLFLRTLGNPAAENTFVWSTSDASVVEAQGTGAQVVLVAKKAGSAKVSVKIGPIEKSINVVVGG